MKKVSSLKIAAVYIGTVVGAGFATGQEVLQFFSSFGIGGLWGIILVTLLFILYGYIIIELGLRLSAKSHLEILKASCGKVIAPIMDIIITFFLFGAVTAMLAGTGALFHQEFGIPIFIGCLIMAILSAITVLTGIKGVFNSISFVAPFLLISVIGISIYALIHHPLVINQTIHTNSNPLLSNWLVSALLYVSYNIILSIAILGPLGAQAKSKKTVRIGASLGGLGLGVSSLMIYFAITAYLPSVKDLEVPLAFIAESISPILKILFSIILIAEVFTTTVGALFGFASRIAENFKDSASRKWKTTVIITVIIAFFASLFGFSNLVKYLYPIIGYVGLLLLILLLISKIRTQKKRMP